MNPEGAYRKLKEKFKQQNLNFMYMTMKTCTCLIKKDEEHYQLLE